MIYRNLIFCFVLSLSVTSCGNEFADLDPLLLEGDWTNETAEINGKPLSDFGLSEGAGTNFLGLKNEEAFYYLDYNSGTWALEDGVITFSNNDRVYKIKAIGENAMTLEAEISENDFYYDIEEFEQDDLFKLTQYFIRQ